MEGGRERKTETEIYTERQTMEREKTERFLIFISVYLVYKIMQVSI